MGTNVRINLGLNTQASVNPALSSLNPNLPNPAPWHGNQGYAGAILFTSFRYAPELGAYGSIVGTIGGHNAYYGNEVVRFDIETRLFAPMSDPYSSTSHPGSFFVINGGHSDSTNGEIFTSAGGATDPTQPVGFHGYSTGVVLPPDAATGVGNKGALITPIRAARTPDGGNHSQRTHIFDLAQANRATAAWARYSTNLWSYSPPEDRFGYGWAVYDPTRKKIFAGIRGNAAYNKLSVLNCVTRQWETPITLSQNVYMLHSNAWHWPSNTDYIINFVNNFGGITELSLINVSTGTVYKPGLTGSGPSNAGGYDFVPSCNRIAVYEGGVGSVNRVWILTPQHDHHSWATSLPWKWTFEDVTGPTPPIQTAGASFAHIGRFVWADKVKCFIWWANGTDNVQAWKVRGFS